MALLGCEMSCVVQELIHNQSSVGRASCYSHYREHLHRQRGDNVADLKHFRKEEDSRNYIITKVSFINKQQFTYYGICTVAHVLIASHEDTVLSMVQAKKRLEKFRLRLNQGYQTPAIMLGDDEKTESMNDTLNFNDEDKEPLLESDKSSITWSRSPSPEHQSESESESEPTDAKFKFTQPPVSRLKRTSLLIFFALLCWLTYSALFHTKKKPKIVYASRSVMFHESFQRQLI